MTNIAIWQPNANELIPATAKTPAEISQYAVQLANKDRQQIVAAFEAAHFEMAVTYLWGKTITALKKELSSVGIGLLGEMLGKVGVDDDDDIDSILTTKDTIRLAEELGVVSGTDGMRLRHTYELISHFSQLESETDAIDETEALSSLNACIRSVLGRPKVEVAKKFVDFRGALEGETLGDGDPRIDMLKSSPYFFNKLTVSVLMNAAKKNSGASLEHALANINVVIPAIWQNLRDTEKWQVGYTYAETYAEGKSTTVAGLKSALLKVQGFDYVPENLRSDTFVKAAEAILRAHDGLNNFYNEPAPVRNLAKLGSTIPTPALPACMSALLCVVLGNSYGVSWSAQADASEILQKLSSDRWGYYLNSVFASDVRVIGKLLSIKPCGNWIALVEKYNFANIPIKNVEVRKLIEASLAKDGTKVALVATKIYADYYGEAK